jgi:hypothetical protein
MMWRVIVCSLVFVVGSLAVAVVPASAQGLLWSLPEDGTWVRHEGTYTQVETRPDSIEGDLQIEWERWLTISSVGREMAEFNNETVPCRWIEIKVETGKGSETGIDAGPIGARIVKVLVPESRVMGKQIDEDQIPVAFIPIVKGYRKIGENPTEEIEAKVLQIFPMVSMLLHYPTIQSTGEEEDPDVRLGPVTATKLKGSYKMENLYSRSENEATLWQSDEVPFGLAKWSVVLLREAKDASESREEFRQVSEITEEMSAHLTGNDAQSELATP